MNKPSTPAGESSPAVYVAGGRYRDWTVAPAMREYLPFTLVSPGTPGSRAYITTDPDGLRLTRHHSHLYRVESDGTATLVRYGDAGITDSVAAPLKVVLTPDQLADIAASIKAGDVYP